jgi:hypothetical protein
VGTRMDQRPGDYLELDGWQRLEDEELGPRASEGGAGFVHADEHEFGLIMLAYLAPQDFLEALGR